MFCVIRFSSQSSLDAVTSDSVNICYVHDIKTVKHEICRLRSKHAHTHTRCVQIDFNTTNDTCKDNFGKRENPVVADTWSEYRRGSLSPNNDDKKRCRNRRIYLHRHRTFLSHTERTFRLGRVIRFTPLIGSIRSKNP